MNGPLTTALLMMALTGWAQPWPASDPANSRGWIPFDSMTDEFEGTQLDQTKWWPTTLYWPGRPPVFHNPNNNAVTGGELVLTLSGNTTGAPAGYDYSSGYIQSKSVRRYLYVEIRAKALNNSIMTTFWLNGAHSTWAREIDIMECRPGVTGREREYFSNFHIWRTPTEDGVDSTYRQDPVIQTLPFNMLEDYHVYGFEWDRDWMKIYVDGSLIRQKPTGSFTLAQSVLIGNEFNSYFSPVIDSNRLPATYNIQYVRAWILPENPTTYYVDGAAGDDANSGLSWAQAKKTIRAAVDASYDGDSIYVAQGHYTEYLTIWGTRNYCLYGGCLPGQTPRNPILHPSVIQAPSDSFTVLEVRSGENIRIDGFTLTGSTQDFASGVMIEGPLTNVVFANCRIVGNHPVNGSGGGASIIGPDAPSSVRFEECEFSDNSSMGLYAGGGALRTADDSRATFVRCLFANNQANGPGSVAQIYWTSPGTMMRFENCIFRGNTAPANAGTVDLNSGSLELINCTFGSQSGDGIRLPNENTANQRSLVVINTIVEGMTGDGLDIGWEGASAIATLQNSVFSGNATQVRYASTARNTAAAINGLAFAAGNLVANPLFRSRASYDYRLATGSPARNGGRSTGAPTNDFDRVARPLDGGYDIGAYESTGLEPLQRPFALTPRTIPGRIEAEQYNDLGGEGVAYHDTTPGNSGGQLRLEDVDVELLPGLAGWSVGFVAGGEWLEYTADVAGGIYELTAPVANANVPTTLRLQVDGAALVTVDVPNTGSWNSFTNVAIPTVALGHGLSRLLRVDFDAAVILDRIEFAVPAVSPGPPTLAWTRTDDRLNFQWAGYGFKIQSQTNGAGLGTNWFDIPEGSHPPASVPLRMETGSVFFRLAPQ